VYVPVNPVPANPEQGYFNYDTNDLNYGPDAWERVDTSSHWIREFGQNGFGIWEGFFPRDLTRNKCGGRIRKQSPKNLTPNAECEAHHEIRTEVC
jgi:hypothetical protein